MREYVNKYYENNAKKLRDMVDRVLRSLHFVDVDKDDFYSLANEVFVQVLMSFDESQDFDGFLYSCLVKKFKTEMTRRCRYKRQADKNSISIDTPIGDEESGCTLKDVIAADGTVESEIFKEDGEWRKEVKEYLDSLSPLQRKIAFLLSDEATPDDICRKLHITMKHFKNSVERILADERIRPLRALV